MGNAECVSGVDKITNYISDMIDYNRIIQVYLNMTNTPQTRIEIFNKIQPLKKMFEKLLDKFEELTEKFMNVDDADMYKRFFMKTLRSEALYDLIDDQFRNNNLFAITERDVENQLMDIISENPAVGYLIRTHGLDTKPPPPPPPAPPVPPPAAPPAAAPAGAPPAGAPPAGARPSVLPVWPAPYLAPSVAAPVAAAAAAPAAASSSSAAAAAAEPA